VLRVSYDNAAQRSGRAGGSGIVVIRYEGEQAGTGGMIDTTSVAGHMIHSFASTGTSQFNLSGLDLNARLGATVSGQITGTGNLSFDGPGRLTLSGNNSYEGTTTVSSGIMVVDGNHTGGGAFSVADGADSGVHCQQSAENSDHDRKGKPSWARLFLVLCFVGKYESKKAGRSFTEGNEENEGERRG